MSRNLIQFVAQHPPDPAEVARREAARRAKVARKAQQAKRCWFEANAIQGTIAETYLREARGITCPLPETLRYHPACWHGPTASRLPALIALVEGGGASYAVHRSYLRPDGSGKASICPDKMALGSTAGGRVCLSSCAGKLVVGEGIETTLSMLCGFLSGPLMAWAALSASGLKTLNLPPTPGRLVIAQDGDAPGRKAAHELAQRAYGLGWKVTLADPGDRVDFNDILTGKVVMT